MKLLDKCKQFTVCNGKQIDLLLCAIENNIEFSYINLPDDYICDLQLLDMAGIINYNYTTKSYYIANKGDIIVSDVIPEAKITEYRMCFAKSNSSRGLKPGCLGDLTKVKKNLRKWLKENKAYTIDDVINTAKQYVKLERDNGYKYLMAADYFIYKNTRSKLSSLIEEYKDLDVTDLDYNHELV